MQCILYIMVLMYVSLATEVWSKSCCGGKVELLKVAVAVSSSC